MPAATITVKVRYNALAVRPTQRWRWRVAKGNHKGLAHGGEGYRDLAGLVHALHQLWPAGADDHVVVLLPGQIEPVALAAL